MNDNTIAGLYGGVSLPGFYPQIAPLVNPTTTAVVVSLNANTVPAVALGGPLFAAIVSLTPGAGYKDGKPFRVAAYGSVISATTNNLTLAFYRVPSAVVALNGQATTGPTVLTNDVVITGATSGAHAVIAGTTNFKLQFDGQFNLVGQLLTGVISGYIGAALVTTAAITPMAVTSDTELNFCLAGLFSGSDVSQIAYVEELVIEQI